MAKVKYTYEKYDYSFLGIKKDNWFNTAVSAAAQTIGFDLSETVPMSEPHGTLYYIDYAYEPIRSGGWEVTFQSPTIITTPNTFNIDGASSSASTMSVTTTQSTSNNTVPWYDFYYRHR